jgi:hypothetical protein
MGLLKHTNTTLDRTIIVHVILYGCKTWSLTLRAEGRQRVLANTVLRKLFGPKRKVTTIIK